MRIKLYCDLYVSEFLIRKKEKIIRKLLCNQLQPQVYVIALSKNSQNHLEIFSSAFLKQHFYEDAEIFIVGIALGYDEAISFIKQIVERVYMETGDAGLRKYILVRQEEFENAGR